VGKYLEDEWSKEISLHVEIKNRVGDNIEC
jgi:hypothetical protein